MKLFKSLWILACSFPVMNYQNAQDYEGTQYQRDPRDVLEGKPDPGLRYVSNYQEAIRSFRSTESFSFFLEPTQIQKISIQPEDTVSQVVAIFHIEIAQDSQAGFYDGINANCEVNSIHLNHFTNQKLGVCIFNITKQSNFINIYFQSMFAFNIYLSYEQKMKLPGEIPKSQNILTEQQMKKNKFEYVNQKFNKIQQSIQRQVGILHMISRSFLKQNNQFKRKLSYSRYRILFETIAVCISGLIGIIVIKKQLNSGYELLV